MIFRLPFKWPFRRSRSGFRPPARGIEVSRGPSKFRMWLSRLPFKVPAGPPRSGFRPNARGVEMRDLSRELERFHWRLAVCAASVVLLFFVLFLRFFYLQVIQHDYYMTLAEQNRISIVPVVPNRGLILDRHGEPLALNRPAYQLELVREQTPDVEDTLARLVSLDLLAAEDGAVGIAPEC